MLFSFYTKILTFIKIIVGLFLTSAITGIYIKITIIAAPVFILLISKFFFINKIMFILSLN